MRLNPRQKEAYVGRMVKDLTPNRELDKLDRVTLQDVKVGLRKLSSAQLEALTLLISEKVTEAKLGE